MLTWPTWQLNRIKTTLLSKSYFQSFTDSWQEALVWATVTPVTSRPQVSAFHPVSSLFISASPTFLSVFFSSLCTRHTVVKKILIALFMMQRCYSMQFFVNRAGAYVFKQIISEVWGLSKYTSDAGIGIVFIRFSTHPAVMSMRKLNWPCMGCLWDMQLEGVCLWNSHVQLQPVLELSNI